MARVRILWEFGAGSVGVARLLKGGGGRNQFYKRIEGRNVLTSACGVCAGIANGRSPAFGLHCFVRMRVFLVVSLAPAVPEPRCRCSPSRWQHPAEGGVRAHSLRSASTAPSPAHCAVSAHAITSTSTSTSTLTAGALTFVCVCWCA